MDFLDQTSLPIGVFSSIWDKFRKVYVKEPGQAIAVQRPKFDLLDESLPLRIISSMYGWFLTRTFGFVSALKWILRILLMLSWTLRTGFIHIFLGRKSLFMVTCYLSEIVMMSHQVMFMVKSEAIHNYFVDAQTHFNSVSAKIREYKLSLKVINYTLLIATIIPSIFMAEYTVGVCSKYPGFLGQHPYLLVIHQLLINTWVLPSCSIYSLALFAYFMRVDMEVKHFKSTLFIRNSFTYEELLRLVSNLQRLHFTFEKTYSFMPFLWISYNWCQATIYLIGVLFGPLKEIYDIALLTWSTYLQVVAFVTIGFIIFINNKVSSKCQDVLAILDEKLNHLGPSGNKVAHLILKLEYISQSKFTTWNFCEIHNSLIFSYLSSLITISVLTLQMDYSDPPN